MPTLNDCLHMIGTARASAEEPESAYVLRTRLKRSLVSATQLAARRAGVDEPLMPEDIDRMHLDHPAAAGVLRVCATLLARTRSLCQPSEALDARWRSGWAEVRQDLDRLERTLISLGDERAEEVPTAEMHDEVQ